MKELDEIRTTHKRSVARRAAKQAEAAQAKAAGTNGSNCTASTTNPTLSTDISNLLMNKI